MTPTCAHEDALRLIARGKTAAAMSARAASPSRYDCYRTAQALRGHLGAEFAPLFTHLVPGDALAAEMAALDASLAAVMAELEEQGQTRESARALLRAASQGTAPGSAVTA